MHKTASIPFVKMQALGNDFVIIDCRETDYQSRLQDYKIICDRKIGVGCDQLIFLHAPQNVNADVFMDMYNADGSPLEACGNATRCVARLLNRDQSVIETVAGLLRCEITSDGLIKCNMGQIKTDWQNIPLAVNHNWNELPSFEGVNAKGYVANIGNPHIVFPVQDIKAIDVEKLGAQIERHPLFPNRINVEFIEIQSDNVVRMRVWERGVGITQACGSGACASAYVAIMNGLVSSNIATIKMDGGDLQIESNDNGVIMCGDAGFVFQGEYFQ